MSVTRIGVKQTDDTVKSVAFLDDVSDTLNPFAEFNRTGKINVGSKQTGKRKLVLPIVYYRDIKGVGRPYPYPTYIFFEGTLENYTQIASIGSFNDESYQNFVTRFNDSSSFSGKIKATAVGTLKCGNYTEYDNGARTVVEFELIGEYANRDDIFIGVLDVEEVFISRFNKLDGIIRANYSLYCYFFKDHTTTDITLNGESIADHIANADIHTTSAEKSVWNNKQDTLTAGNGIVIENNVISTTAPVPETTLPADDELKHNHLYILQSVDGLDLSSVTVEDYATVDLWIDYTTGTVTTSSDWSWVDGIELPENLTAGTRYMIKLQSTGEAILAKLNYSYTNVND